VERILHFDCFSGASGDMVLGACVDAGAPVALVRDVIDGLALEGVGLRVDRVRRGGIDATKVTVETAPAAASAHPHRHLADILRLIERSGLPEGTRSRAETLFRRLADAEAAVHGIPVERVHFHEVGAVDSIVDVVAGVAAIGWFGADRVTASPLNTGSGTVRCAHGVMPVPAPATARLVAGVPVYADGPATELLTPTGALLITGHATEYGPLPAMRVERAGYGAGDKEFAERPNVLRLLVGTAAAASVAHDRGASAATPERMLVLECEVDDLNPQVLGELFARLFATGARDVLYTPVQMKKNRPGTLITVLADPDGQDALLDVLFAETTTLGVRFHEVWREALVRETRPVSTTYGEVRIKLAWRKGRLVNAAPEFEDCAGLARAAGVPVREVLAAALHAWRAGTAPSGAPPAASRD
jgi:uncharacterized protein (TIGR00299 family) protein